MCAAFKGKCDVVAELKSFGADVDTQNNVKYSIHNIDKVSTYLKFFWYFALAG